jgi:hypothetical protein
VSGQVLINQSELEWFVSTKRLAVMLLSAIIRPFYDSELLVSALLSLTWQGDSPGSSDGFDRVADSEQLPKPRPQALGGRMG